MQTFVVCFCGRKIITSHKELKRLFYRRLALFQTSFDYTLGNVAHDSQLSQKCSYISNLCTLYTI